MDMDSIILIANPGSASRKYALYKNDSPLATIHFEYVADAIHYTLTSPHRTETKESSLKELSDAPRLLISLLREHQILRTDETIQVIGLRFVAPGSYFAQDHIVDDEFVAKLEATLPRAPLHIAATLGELRALRQQFNETPIIGVSDSAFHAGKPSHALYYGLPLEDADAFEIKRYGYHGLSVMSVVDTLKKADQLSPKVIVAHLGSGASITAVENGKSIDSSMGYSPLEGLIMSTRSGTIDAAITHVLRAELNLDDAQLETYLNKKSGLLGLGGSDDIRELLEREASGDHRAKLALDTYVYAIQKMIAQMAIAMNGVDTVVFTGTVGLRSAPIRERVVTRLEHLGFEINTAINTSGTNMSAVSHIEKAGSKPIFMVETDEHMSILQQIIKALVHPA